MSQDILHWLQNVPAQTELALKQARTGKRQRSYHPTPPPEEQNRVDNDMADASLTKKRKTGHQRSVSSATPQRDRSSDDQDEAGLEEATPRPAGALRLSPPRGAPSNASSQTRSSTPSSASCPKKHFAAMSLFETGFDFRDLADTASQPKSLTEMCTYLKKLRRGRGILGASSESKFARRELGPGLDPEFATFTTDADYFFSAERDTLGSTPSPEDVMYILESAIECSSIMQAECCWNSQVHHPLLALSLRQRTPGQTYKQLIKVAPCSTASLIQEYKPLGAPNKKIDYCIFIDPKYDAENSAIAAQIDIVRHHLPLLSINTTGEFSLLQRPLAIPIETRRPGEGWDGAALQESTWLGAQIVFLQQLLKLGKSAHDAPSLDEIGFRCSIGQQMPT
ncbi:hypothetical protein F66182_10585 [Fusarium sp. NRRL 66182]|nr:hypothetical protein F66182_10585 [Fusarium sp. NRRL 66182]